jgi:phosphatidylglycerol lysyltransferase
MPVAIHTKIRPFSPKLYWKEILALLMLLLAFIFFRGERRELPVIIPHIRNASPIWLLAGIVVSLLYVLLQSGMYVKSFASIGLTLKWIDAIELFLKRNFLGVFLPVGGVSALAYTPSQLRKRGFNNTQVQQASALYWFAGMLTVFLVGLPVTGFALTGNQDHKDAWIGVGLILCLLSSTYRIARSLKQKGKLYRLIERKLPGLIPAIDKFFATTVTPKKYWGAVACSAGIEATGILHVFIAMLALGLHASFLIAAIVYMTSVLLMIASPFLRGLGAVEIAMVLVLGKYGYTPVQALSITILYRVFEFWIPLIFGLLAFAWRGRHLFIRVVPALLIFSLGLINIISVVTPPLHPRLKLLREFMPLEAIDTSNMLVLFVGLALLVTSAFMIKGLKNAWLIALALSIFSLIGNLAKALDYEEAIFAGSLIILLLFTRSQYRIRGNLRLIRVGILSALLIFLSVMVFGFVSFYFIDRKHFGPDFSWQQSAIHTLKSFLLVKDASLHPLTRFGHQFIGLLRGLGFITWGFLLFTLIKPFLKIEASHGPGREKAAFLLAQYGNSAMDYFKLCKDKLFFFSDRHDAFVAYRVANGFAIVLDVPVCAEENKIDVLQEFDVHCRKMGLKTAFYRVDENSITWFNQLRKQKIIIGQEAILDVAHFSLGGTAKKSLRNGLNCLHKKGFRTTVHTAPLNDAMIVTLKKISDEWLDSFDKKELTFSQGMFDAREIKQHDIITITDEQGQLVAFLNIIPDYAPDECTYDLIRKTRQAPGACMDALIIGLIGYAKEKKIQYLNLGLVPMSGILQPNNPAEQLMKYAGEKLNRFKHYQTLRNFKDKYATIWENKFLVYENDFDLLQLPAALKKVMQPK